MGTFGTSMKFKTASVVLAVLAAAGVGTWICQLMNGLGVTGMNNSTSWGLYITMFMFLVGLSAGGLIISSVPRAFGMKGFGGISKIAVWTSICCTVLAVGFVVIDLGQPLRLWELFAYSNLGSPLMWDIAVLATYLVLSIVYLWAMLRYESGKGSAVSLRVISTIALITAILVHSVTAWIFGLQQGREMWHTALLAPWFVSSALVCGVALVLVVVIALRKAGYLELDQANVVKLVKMLGAFVVVDLYFFGCDLLTAGFPGGSGSEIVAMLATGPLAPFSGSRSSAARCAPRCASRRSCARTRSSWSPACWPLSASSASARSCWWVGSRIPNLDYAGPSTQYTVTDWTSGMAGAYQGMVYWPTPMEFGIVLGVFGLGR